MKCSCPFTSGAPSVAYFVKRFEHFFFQNRGRVLKISATKHKTTDQNMRLYLFNVFKCLETQLMQQTTRVF